MNSMEWTARLVGAFERRIQRLMSLNRLSTLMGHSTAFLAKILGHDRGPRVGDLFEAQVKAGDANPSDLYHQAFEQATNDPLRILAGCRRRQGREPLPFLLAVGPRLLRLAKEGGQPEVHWRCRIEAIRTYERLIEKDRKRSQQTLEKAITVGIDWLDRRKERPLLALGDLGFALSSLSVVLRLEDNLDDALDALLLAHPLIVAAGSPLGEGLWYQRAAHLLVRLERPDRAAEFIKEAAVSFVAAASKRDLARILVDLGNILHHAGEAAEACRQLKRALAVLDPEDDIYIFTAHQILALELAAAGNFSEAEDELRKALRIAKGRDLLVAWTHWNRAQLWASQKSFDRAVVAYRKTFELLARFGSPPNVIAVAFEFASLLLDLKNRPELKRLAAEVLRYSAESEIAPELRETIENFAALLRLETLNRHTFNQLRKSLPEAPQDPDDRTRAPSQPNGSKAGPISGISPVPKLLFGGSWSTAS